MSIAGLSSSFPPAELPPQRPGSQFPLIIHPPGSTPDSALPNPPVPLKIAFTGAALGMGAAVVAYAGFDSSAVAHLCSIVGGSSGVVGAIEMGWQSLHPYRQVIYIDQNDLVVQGNYGGVAQRFPLASTSVDIVRGGSRSDSALTMIRLYSPGKQGCIGSYLSAEELPELRDILRAEIRRELDFRAVMPSVQI